MNQIYREATTEMESTNVQLEYILGWQGGFLGHPLREEQRLNDAYQAGYDDGSAKITKNFSNWVES
jgi:hypothetical protein